MNAKDNSKRTVHTVVKVLLHFQKSRVSFDKLDLLSR